ncbi:unnamed protein product, partial [Allacma fusca]
MTNVEGIGITEEIPALPESKESTLVQEERITEESTGAIESEESLGHSETNQESILSEEQVTQPESVDSIPTTEESSDNMGLFEGHNSE